MNSKLRQDLVGQRRGRYENRLSHLRAWHIIHLDCYGNLASRVRVLYENMPRVARFVSKHCSTIFRSRSVFPSALNVSPVAPPS